VFNTVELDGEKTHWITTSSVRGAALRAPRRPGVYVVGTVRRVAGLPVEADWAYVGRATGAFGLSGRLRAHEPIREENDGLRAWLMTPREGLEVWLAPTRSELEAIELEAELIAALRPTFNTVGNPSRVTGNGSSTEEMTPSVA
jgi:excinuclease UvrABC nuclease subunit